MSRVTPKAPRCLRCRKKPRWRLGIWCSRCVGEVCCAPARAAGRWCVHAAGRGEVRL